ncbi:hypothetical protein [Azospirillum argentinense]|uniref:hypothetical protein n=1 Tax=Azospirillum argentinense TaxID=2970906 RepID=UPI0032E03D50
MAVRTLAILMIVINVVVFVTLTYLEKVNIILLAPPEMKPFDVATIALASSALVLTGTAVVVAVVTLLGYKAIRQAAVSAATQEVLRRVIPVAEDAATRTAREVAAQAAVSQPVTESEAVSGFTQEDGGDEHDARV